MPEQPDIRGILDPLGVDRGVKAQAWEEFHAAADPRDFQTRFDKLEIPREAKAALWNARFGGGVDRSLTVAARNSDRNTGADRNTAAVAPAIAPERAAALAELKTPTAQHLPSREDFDVAHQAYVAGQIQAIETPPAVRAPFINPQANRPFQDVFRGPSDDKVAVPFLGERTIPGAGRVKDSGPGRAYQEFSDIVFGALKMPPPKKGSSRLEAAEDGLLRLVAGLSTPETVAVMLTGAGLAKLLPAIVNLPKVAAALKDSPKLAKGFDMAAAAAVPAAFSAQMGREAVGSAKETLHQLRNDNGAAATAALVEYAGSVILAGVGAGHATRAAKGVSGQFPPTEATGTVKPAAKAFAKEIGIKPQEAISPAQAGAAARTLEAGGRRLAASQWRAIAQNNPIDLGGGLRVEMGQTSKSRPHYRVVDAEGNVRVGGTRDAVSAWIDQNVPSPAKTLPMAELGGEMGTAPARGMRGSAPPAIEQRASSEASPPLRPQVDIQRPAGTPASRPAAASPKPLAHARGSEGGVRAETLPPALRGAKPRYAFGDRQFDLTFEDDLDKAAYIAAQKTPSKKDAEYLAFTMERTGLDEPDVRALGGMVRAQIKAQAKGAEPGALTVGPVVAPFLERQRKAGNLEAVKPEARADAGREASAQAGTVHGAAATAKVAKGYTVDTEYAVVPSGSLVVSHGLNFEENPAYPQEIQPRDRTRKASQQQVAEIFQKLDPAELGASYKATDGAPIVGGDLVVESGNGRTLAIQRAYREGAPQALRYKEYLTAHAAEYGLDARAVAAMPDPQLVRVRKTLPEGVTRADFARHANEDFTAAMSATEQAAADAAKLHGGLMGSFSPSDEGDLLAASNRDFVRGFFDQVVGPTERGRYMLPDGSISQEGVVRVRNAVFARAYGESGAIEKMAESPDSNIRNITNGMVRAAPALARVAEGVAQGNLHALDIAPDVAEAARKLSALRTQGQPVDQYLKQGEMFGAELSPEARNLLGAFAYYSRSATRLGEVLQAYADAVERLGNPAQDSMFGAEIPDKLEVLKAAIAVVEGRHGKGKQSQSGLPGQGSASAPARGGEAGEDARANPDSQRSPAEGQTQLDKLRAIEAAARARIDKRGTFKGTRLPSLIPVDDLADLAAIGAVKIARGARTFTAWSREMLADVGARVKPHLLRIYARARNLHARYRASKFGSERGSVNLDLFGPDESQAQARAIEERKLLGARLTAQMKSGLAMRPGKKAKGPEQTGLFEETPEPAQGSLFGSERGSIPLRGSRAVKPALTGPPASKQQLSELRKKQRHLDIPEVQLKALAQKISGQPDPAKLTQPHAAELLALVGTKLASGNPRYSASVGPLDRAASSPSRVLGRSLYGARIYREAEKQFFEQERLVRRFTKNYHKVVAGLSRAERNEIARFRLRIDERGDRTETPAPLSAKLAEVNGRLSTLVYEPMFRIGVAHGLVSDRQHIDDYLPYYREDKFPGVAPAEIAAGIAQEMGLPVDAVEEIMSEADQKNVRFGPFDYSRLAKARPELRKLDQVSEIYIKGFARKVAITDFLAVANKARGKIRDEGMRKFTKEYIDHYAGKPRYSAADDWLERQLQHSPWLRSLKLSPARIAGVLTAVQYQAKIGGNMFSPALNLTQTLVTTVPKFGLGRTLQQVPKGMASALLPNALNPFVRDMARLRRAGVLDSQGVKFERPHFAGFPEKMWNFLSYLFDRSEQFNRATAFLAGHAQARRAGLSEAAAIEKGREAVRLTQFFTGRLDAPLMTRSPLGRVVGQFKTFTFKLIEGFGDLTGAQKTKFAAMAMALGGPAALGILQSFQAFLPHAGVTRELEKWQETWNLAAFLHADHLGKQFGIYSVPGIETYGGKGIKGTLLEWAAGPTINSILDIVEAATKGKEQWTHLYDKNGKPTKLITAIARDVPAGVELLRVEKSFREAKSTEDVLRILAGFERPEPKKSAPKRR